MPEAKQKTSPAPIVEKTAPYRVLARKYRPQNFSELIGQDALVRTLTNAIDSGRIAHAFMLTGVRGVGKTTTARIIAKALNYAGPDGQSDPTTGATNDCDICKAISEDRHPDVIEMDAASHTGVDDIRDILEGVRYAPTQARYKVYVIDEVHMLSKNAFNALLKTLEEPPEHVKFIFATTEIRKVPITVLSRCQRFDLRRVDVPTLTAHFASICEKEGKKADETALTMIARAADGSVRDGLSILDQAMALTDDVITSDVVESMLGLADRARSLDLLECVLTGETPKALEIMDDLYRSGADPLVLMQDLLALAHILTKFRAVPATKGMKHAMAADQAARAAELADKLSMPTLSKTWQILLKGIAEVQSAPNPQSAAEMVIIRLVYAADLPDPAELLKKLEGQEYVSASGSKSENSASQVSASVKTALPQGASQKNDDGVPVARTRGGNNDMRAALAIVPKSDPPLGVCAIKTLEDIVGLLEGHGEVLLASNVYQYAHLVALKDGLIEINPAKSAPPRLTQDLTSTLKRITGDRWVVSVSSAEGQPTLAQTAQAVLEAERLEIMELPIIKEIFSVFPEAEIKSIVTNKTES